MGDAKVSCLRHFCSPAQAWTTLSQHRSSSASGAGWSGGLTGNGRVHSEGPEAGHLLPAGHLHAGAEDVLPGVQLQQLDATEHLVGLLQPLVGILLPAVPRLEKSLLCPHPAREEGAESMPTSQTMPSSCAHRDAPCLLHSSPFTDRETEAWPVT